MTSPNLRVSIRKGGVMEDFREDHMIFGGGHKGYQSLLTEYKRETIEN